VWVDPSSWAFSIWGLIYSLIAVYIVYQVLPNSWVAPPKGEYSRNEDLLVNKIYWILPVHLIGNASWLFLFQANTAATFWIAEVVIGLMLASAIWILKLCLEERLSLWELIGLRVGFTIYCGWLTAATILGFSIAGKASGMNDAKMGVGYEEGWAVAILYIGWAIYIASSWWQKNPLFAAVMFWPWAAIADQQGGKGRVVIQYHCYTIMSMHAVYVSVFLTWMIYNKVRYNHTKKEIKGLFY
jgi:hypothetical protein